MRCKKHISDFSSTVGVCATCLRERLTFLIAAQAQAQAQLSRDCSRNSDVNPPPPLIFPRSVSPYVSRRKSDYSAPGACHHGGDRRENRENLFYSTPQVGPSFYTGANAGEEARSIKKRLSKFWSFSNFFKHRSEKFRPDPSLEQSSTASPSWFSNFFPARRRNRDRAGRAEDFAVGARRRYRPTDRGMSPVRIEDSPDECDQCDSSETSPWWRRTPSRLVVAPSARRSRVGRGMNVTGLDIAFCLSPLVRASPNRRWNNKGMPPEIAAAADVRATATPKPHLSAAASFCANRSRKLVDFGRVNQNR